MSFFILILLIMLKPFFFVNRRGVPMALFTLIAIGGTGLAPVYAGWISINPNLEWKWIQWVHMMYVTASKSLTETCTKNVP